MGLNLMRHSGFRRVVCLPGWLLFLYLVMLATAGTVHGQGTCERIMEQDPGINNLVDPPGYETAELGTLGDYQVVGNGAQAMILIPGLGFGGDVFGDLMAPLAEDHTMYAVTLPGFAGTPAPPCPPESTSFGEQTWTNGALAGIEAMIAREGIERPIVVGHWMTGTQLALRLALDHPDEVTGVIIISGTTRFTPTDTTSMPAHPELEQRIAGIDRYLAPRWYKTVTRETWDDNNFLPVDYAVNPVRGLRMWREAARPPLHVWVRYLCEFYAQDVSLELGDLSVPTLVLKPGLEGIYHDPGNNYMAAYCHAGWDGPVMENPNVTIKTIPDSRIFMWYDQPEAFETAVTEFLDSLE